VPSALSVGNPTVNGSPAGTAPGPQVASGQNAAGLVTVTNTGTNQLTNLKATSPKGTLSCAATTLNSGQSTTCGLSSVAGTGAQNDPVTVTAVDPAGKTLSGVTTLNYLGTSALALPSGTTSGVSSGAAQSQRPITVHTGSGGLAHTDELPVMSLLLLALIGLGWLTLSFGLSVRGEAVKHSSRQ
jgi:hypothetical protein